MEEEKQELENIKKYLTLERVLLISTGIVIFFLIFIFFTKADAATTTIIETWHNGANTNDGYLNETGTYRVYPSDGVVVGYNNQPATSSSYFSTSTAFYPYSIDWSWYKCPYNTSTVTHYVSIRDWNTDYLYASGYTVDTSTAGSNVTNTILFNLYDLIPSNAKWYISSDFTEPCIGYYPPQHLKTYLGNSTSSVGNFTCSTSDPYVCPEMKITGTTSTLDLQHYIQWRDLKEGSIVPEFDYWRFYVSGFDQINNRIMIAYNTGLDTNPPDAPLYDYSDIQNTILFEGSSTRQVVSSPVQNGLYHPDLGEFAVWRANAYLVTSSTYEVIAETGWITFSVFDAGYHTPFGQISGYGTSTTGDIFSTSTYSEWCSVPTSTTLWGLLPAFFDWQHLTYGGCRLVEILFRPNQQIKAQFATVLDQYKITFPFNLFLNLGSPTGYIFGNVPTSSDDLYLTIPATNKKIPILTSTTLESAVGSSTKNTMFTVMKWGSWGAAFLAVLSILF